ncbi:NCS1 family nucleobase:cation symporter-1 [Hymenobacter monticola]|uniref:NCS1 family nucleobase:cation symporter-1 n=1 Tax=Hymenobacter monticola TaxID=1705399 RepID=A0ABY4B968_9BACT|nr:NCS1 family nucleobase:cation symporter-1 [Hymenobacter monticola]UOE35595.1 NCS1 family nucleobase:cation symporter-1 [Hymenobacter monticola]
MDTATATHTPDAGLTSPDLAPVAPAERTWGTGNYAALWVSMSLCIPTYMLASSLIEGGMNWWQALLTIFLGNTIVLVPMLLNGRAGAQYGIPFPVFARASFGVRGANVPALLRAIIACGWFGIQTWIGGYALYQMAVLWVPGLATLPAVFPASWGLTTGPALLFFLFWLLNMYVVHKGVDSIRKLLVFKAFFLPVAALALLWWAIAAGKGLGPILAQPSKFTDSAQFWAFFFPSLTGMVGFWATLSLNIPDFTRYATSQRAQQLGQAIGLPTSMTMFSFVGVVVTSATFVIYGKTIWDPVVLAGKFDSKLLVSFAMLAVALSTLATNIAANIVSPANDFANLSPERISFKTGGYITGVIGLLTFPWKLIADPTGFIFTWLVGYSGLLGPIGGIMIVDYYLLRRQRLDLAGLYQYRGPYAYRNGVNRAAIWALVLGVLPNIPGFLVAVGALGKDAVWPALVSLYNYSWFVGFLVSGGVYLLLMRTQTAGQSAPNAAGAAAVPSAAPSLVP